MWDWRKPLPVDTPNEGDEKLVDLLHTWRFLQSQPW
jgi:hypothetical protein